MRRTRAEPDIVFRSPRIGADLAILVVLLPIAVASVAFLVALVAVPFILSLALDPDDRTLIAWCVLAAIPIVMLLVRLKFFWSMTLAVDALRLGRLWPRRILYDRVRFIKAGWDSDPIAAVKHEHRAVIPFSFATGWLRHHRLFLRDGDARRCLKELHARCPNAVAIDADERVFPPRNAEAGRKSYAEHRILQSLAVRVAGALTIAVFALAFLAFPNRVESLQDLRSEIGRMRLLWIALPLVPALLAYALRNAVRIRRIIRGDWTET